jgi:type I restriction enzyme S subunit
MDDQRRIADILDRADALRTKRREAFALLDELTHSIFVDMFGHANAGRWPLMPLGDLISDAKLGLVRSSAEFGPGYAVPYVRMNAITRGGELDVSNVQRTDVTASELAEYSLKFGDLLFNTRNSRDLVGKSALVRNDEPAVFNNNILRIRFDGAVSPDYIAQVLLSPHGARELDRRKSGTTNVFAVYYKDLKSLPIPFPPIDMQKKFSSVSAQITRCRESMKIQLSELHAMFASLQQRAFAGEL